MSELTTIETGSATAMMAVATVKTAKASRYLKALCNHFDRKAEATYEDDQGHVIFAFGRCDMKASEDELLLQVEAANADNFGRMKGVIGSHLERFSGNEGLNIEWISSAA